MRCALWDTTSLFFHTGWSLTVHPRVLPGATPLLVFAPPTTLRLQWLAFCVTPQLTWAVLLSASSLSMVGELALRNSLSTRQSSCRTNSLCVNSRPRCKERTSPSTLSRDTEWTAQSQEKAACTCTQLSSSPPCFLLTTSVVAQGLSSLLLPKTPAPHT